MSCPHSIDIRVTKSSSRYYGRTFKAPCRRCAYCKSVQKGNLQTMFTWELISAYKKRQSACFVTLTYDNSHLPIVIGNDLTFTKRSKDGRQMVTVNAHSTLVKKHFQDFNKRVRRRIQYFNEKKGANLPNYKFLCAGEYGDKKGRPHYHMIVFGYTATDYSKLCKGLWRNGTVEIEPLRGVNGIGYLLDYLDNSEPRDIRQAKYLDKGYEPPFVTHSQNIGKEYFNEYMSDFIANGMQVRHKDKWLPLPKSFRDKIRKLFGYTYSDLNDMDVYNRDRELKAKAQGYKDYASYDLQRSYAMELILQSRYRDKGIAIPVTKDVDYIVQRYSCSYNDKILELSKECI